MHLSVNKRQAVGPQHGSSGSFCSRVEFKEFSSTPSFQLLVLRGLGHLSCSSKCLLFVLAFYDLHDRGTYPYHTPEFGQYKKKKRLAPELKYKILKIFIISPLNRIFFNSGFAWRSTCRAESKRKLSEGCCIRKWVQAAPRCPRRSPGIGDALDQSVRRFRRV